MISDESQPEWAEILDVLYENQVKKLEMGDDPHEDTQIGIDDLREDLEMSRIDVKNALEYMSAAGLVTQAGSPSSSAHFLTPKGFEVAHDRWLQRARDEKEDERLESQEENEMQRAEQQHEVNRAIAFLTLGLMTVTVIDSTVRAFVGAGDYYSDFGVVIIGPVLIMLMTGLLYYFGLLSPLSQE